MGYIHILKDYLVSLKIHYKIVYLEIHLEI